MARAWKMHRRLKMEFKKCLQLSWRDAKDYAGSVTPQVMNRIMNNLKVVSIAATTDHFRMMNCNRGRKILRRSDDDETKQMVVNGEVFLNDIIHPRRLLSARFEVRTARVQKRFRNRIIKRANCVPVNIEQYVAANG